MVIYRLTSISTIAGLTNAGMPAVIRLRKSRYGLPLVPATFCAHSDTTLCSYRFTPTVTDPRLHVRLLDDGTKAHVGVLVGALAAIQDVYRCVESDLGYYLGMKLV